MSITCMFTMTQKPVQSEVCGIGTVTEHKSECKDEEPTSDTTATILVVGHHRRCRRSTGTYLTVNEDIRRFEIV
jgi:hypothetical protein